MTNTISSLTPERVPQHCPICGKVIRIEPFQPIGDAPCPNCGTLLGFFATSGGMRFHESERIALIWNRVSEILGENSTINGERITPQHRLAEDLGLESLDWEELIMDLEEQFKINIPSEDAVRIATGTAGDIVEYIVRRKL